jgi:ubiquitin C-terminal hydrolase
MYELFARTEQSAFTCVSCGHSWRQKQRDRQPVLQLPLRDCDLTDLAGCFADYARPELPERFQCPSCKQLSCVSKSLQNERGPAVLAIQLKRTVYNAGADEPRKVLTPIALPLSMHWAGRRYELRAAVLHEGEQTEAGHNTALVRTAANGGLLCDDDAVERVDDLASRLYQDDTMAAVYLAFYAAEDGDAADSGSDSDFADPPGEHVEDSSSDDEMEDIAQDEIEALIADAAVPVQAEPISSKTKAA